MRRIPETSPPPTGRFAPSPTGPLHTGSLVTAVGSYLLARQAGGCWLLRIDDLDTPRLVAGMADDIMRTLESFSLLWDGLISWQSRHLDDYRQAFELLRQTGHLYPCGCSRKEIAASASAPHHDDDGIPYPGFCRSGLKAGAVIRSWRVRVPDDDVSFHDRRCGTVCQHLPGCCGDFVVRRGDAGFAYQLAVVVDDALSGVTQVVRGEDLLASTPRQIYLQRLLGYPEPAYCHLPLVTGPSGTKLSKRDHLVSYRRAAGGNGKNKLLLAIMRFLGQDPPGMLEGAPCSEILSWGCAHFDADRLPDTGGELVQME